MLVLIAPAPARDWYHPREDIPAFAVAVDSEFLLPRVGWFRYVPEAGYDL